jgi:cytolysin-activating lysine-acyltransferase
MRSAQHRILSLGDLDWLVLPAMANGQYSIAQISQAGTPTPIGVLLWAMVSADVEQRLLNSAGPLKLQPAEWRSGDIPWVVEVAGDARTEDALLRHLGEMFKGQEIKRRTVGPDGKVKVGTFKGA